jgi:hypothetical protein
MCPFHANHSSTRLRRAPWTNGSTLKVVTLVHPQLTTDHSHSFDLSTVLQNFDYCFSENGLTAYKMGVQLESQVFPTLIFGTSECSW